MLSCTLDTYTSIWICSLARFILSTDYPAQYLMKRRKCNVNVTTRSNLRNVIIGTSSFQTSWKHATGTRSQSERERVFRRLAYFPDCPRTRRDFTILRGAHRCGLFEDLFFKVTPYGETGRSSRTAGYVNDDLCLRPSA